VTSCVQLVVQSDDISSEAQKATLTYSIISSSSTSAMRPSPLRSARAKRARAAFVIRASGIRKALAFQIVSLVSCRRSLVTSSSKASVLALSQIAHLTSYILAEALRQLQLR
jgi:hypothetical protein